MTMSVTTAADDAPAASTSGTRSSVMPPMATSGQSIFARHSADAVETLRRPGHRFELRLIDRPKRDVVGLDTKRDVEFAQAMRADADPDACGFDRGNVGTDEVALAEMHEAGAKIDRFTPIVVDDELAAMGRRKFEGSRNLGLDRKRRHILDAKLDELRALARDTGDPGGVGKDGIERIERAAAQETRSILKNGVPATGVEGDAMSRGSISPASKPRRPASIARANACAIFTGSADFATAVLSSTAS